MSKYPDILKGSDLRSIGKANQIVRMINTQKEFDDLFTCLYHSDRKVVMRTADAIEKITLDKVDFLQNHKTELLNLCNSASNIELKWHLALLVSRIRLTQKELGNVWNLLKDWATDKRESKIVRVNSIQGLFSLVQQKNELLPNFKLTIAEIKKENVASINARIKKLQNASR